VVLSYESLRKSIGALKRSVAVANSDFDTRGSDLQDTVRAGVIQNFEVAYEQCWKMIQRWIRENRTPVDADNPRTRNELFRMAARYGLFSDPAPWFGFGEARNLTSHTYDESQAVSAYDAALKFLPLAEELLVRLESSND
jgi:nucleotidyltransferase substrate binding protein (TIGR01987 family)